MLELHQGLLDGQNAVRAVEDNGGIGTESRTDKYVFLFGEGPLDLKLDGTVLGLALGGYIIQYSFEYLIIVSLRFP